MGKINDSGKSTKESYKEHLGSRYWASVKRKVLLRDRFVCRQCEKVSPLLEVHHLTYKDKDGKSIVGRELEFLELLVPVCPKCHALIHRTKSHPLNPANFKK
jgi:5-methylcytosine-specific restriction endonuclease McrA